MIRAFGMLPNKRLIAFSKPIKPIIVGKENSDFPAINLLISLNIAILIISYEEVK